MSEREASTATEEGRERGSFNQSAERIHDNIHLMRTGSCAAVALDPVQYGVYICHQNEVGSLARKGPRRESRSWPSHDLTLVGSPTSPLGFSSSLKVFLPCHLAFLLLLSADSDSAPWPGLEKNLLCESKRAASWGVFWHLLVDCIP